MEGKLGVHEEIGPSSFKANDLGMRSLISLVVVYANYANKHLARLTMWNTRVLQEPYDGIHGCLQ